MTGSRRLRPGTPKARLLEAIKAYISGCGEVNCNFTIADIPDIQSIKGLTSLINSGFIIKVGETARHRNIYQLADPIVKEAQP